jgi:hypothetical protein
MMNERENFDGLSAWIGRECTEVQRREYDWVFSFENAGAVTCACPWRIICDDHIALANIDDGQLFGLKVPVNAPAKAKELFAGKKVVSVQAAPKSADLTVSFERETILELFNHSSGYEGWQATAQNGSASYFLVAMGGGRLAMWKK